MTRPSFSWAVVVSLVLAVTACDSDRSRPIPGSTPGPTAPGPIPPAPSAPITLSGQVFEVIPGRRVPAANFPVLAVVVVTSGCPRPCLFTRTWTRWNGTTGPDGRYRFTDLPSGSAIVLATSVSHRQLCGAAAELRAGDAIDLDIEVTSTANSLPPTTLTPIRVGGQIYEITPEGRIGVEGAWIGMDWIANDSPFLTIYSGTDGRYTVCGIPPDTNVSFDAGKVGYHGWFSWRTFRSDATIDIELRRE